MKRLTILDLQEKKNKKEKLVAVTAYDATFASLVGEAVDVVLVGDSLGMVIQGQDTTLNVSLEDMIYHTKAVAQRLHHAHLVSDMPFLTYQISKEEALKNAGLLLKAGAQSVKVEGGIEMCETVHHLTCLGIPVMGHVGLTPQSLHRFGGYKVQGRKSIQARDIIEDAKALEDAGAFSIVLEGIPLELAKEITQKLKIPTIGIGAGQFCDGQVMVIHDLLGLAGEFKPKFVKRYAEGGEIIKNAVKEYIKDVTDGNFPTDDHSYFMDERHLRPVQKGAKT